MHQHKGTHPPKRRPIQPKQPFFTVFHPMGLHFGGHTPSRRGLAASTRGNYAIQGSDTPATRRQRASHGAKPPLLPVWRAPEGPEGTGGIGGPGCGARGRWRSLAGLRDDTPISDPAPLVWRAPEGLVGLAAVPVGGGGAWPGFETTRRAKLAARTASGRAAAHGAARPARAHKRPEHPWGSKQTSSTQQRARSAAAPRAPHSRVSVAHRLSWMLRPGTASISSRV